MASSPGPEWRDGKRDRATSTLRLVWGLGCLGAVLLTAGGWWAVGQSRHTVQRQIETVLLHSGPLQFTGAVSVSRTRTGTTWRVWTSCVTSAQPMGLRDPQRYHRGGANGMTSAALRVEAALGTTGPDGQTGRDLAAILRRWPTEVWLDGPRGVLVATQGSWRVVCLLMTNVPLEGERTFKQSTTAGPRRQER